MKDLLDMFYIQGGTHEIILYAITIDPHQPIRMSLSAEGEKAAAVAVEQILAELSADTGGSLGSSSLGTMINLSDLRPAFPKSRYLHSLPVPRLSSDMELKACCRCCTLLRARR